MVTHMGTVLMQPDLNARSQVTWQSHVRTAQMVKLLTLREVTHNAFKICML